MNKVKDSLPHIITIISIAFVTAILGEIKITVFNSPFRFGLGSAAFFFSLLFYREVSFFYTGIVSGFFITFFRIGIDYFTISPFDFQLSFLNHSPIIGYYLVFSLVLLIGRARNFIDYPFYIGTLGAFSDGFANIIELFIRYIIHEKFLLTPSIFEYVLIIAILRSYFVVGLFNMFYTKQIKAVINEQKKRYEKIQMISSGLYVEAFYLKKLLNEIENVTAKSFKLYQHLKNNSHVSLDISNIALTVAQEVHEVKKDNQRVLAGLNKIIDQESVMLDMYLSDIIDLIIGSNQKYASMLNKDIEFIKDLDSDFKIDKVYPVVVILNNLISNSTEALTDEGIIKLEVKKNGNVLEINITDNGPGVPEEIQTVIFEPGFTTKFDEAGHPSTGIGLSHVKSMVNQLDGAIRVISNNAMTEFQVKFPIAALQKGE